LTFSLASFWLFGHGLSLFISDLHSFQLIAQTAWFQVIRVVPECRHDPILVTNLYLSHDPRTRNHALAKLRSLPCWQTDSAAARSIIFGDFNRTATQALSLLSGENSMGPNLRVLTRRNGQPVQVTRIGMNANGRETRSAIDHCIVSQAALRDSYTMVKKSELSDHFPLLSRTLFQVSPQPALPQRAPKKGKFFLREIEIPRGINAGDKSLWSKKFTGVVTHTSFDALNVYMAEARETAVGNVLSQESINKSAELWGRRL
jgi:hypothetical protein